MSLSGLIYNQQLPNICIMMKIYRGKKHRILKSKIKINNNIEKEQHVKMYVKYDFSPTKFSLCGDKGITWSV